MMKRILALSLSLTVAFGAGLPGIVRAAEDKKKQETKAKIKGKKPDWSGQPRPAGEWRSVSIPGAAEVPAGSSFACRTSDCGRKPDLSDFNAKSRPYVFLWSVTPEDDAKNADLMKRSSEGKLDPKDGVSFHARTTPTQYQLIKKNGKVYAHPKKGEDIPLDESNFRAPMDSVFKMIVTMDGELPAETSAADRPASAGSGSSGKGSGGKGSGAKGAKGPGEKAGKGADGKGTPPPVAAGRDKGQGAPGAGNGSGGTPATALADGGKGRAGGDAGGQTPATAGNAGKDGQGQGGKEQKDGGPAAGTPASGDGCAKAGAQTAPDPKGINSNADQALERAKEQTAAAIAAPNAPTPEGQASLPPQSFSAAAKETPVAVDPCTNKGPAKPETQVTDSGKKKQETAPPPTPPVQTTSSYVDDIKKLFSGKGDGSGLNSRGGVAGPRLSGPPKKDNSIWWQALRRGLAGAGAGLLVGLPLGLMTGGVGLPVSIAVGFVIFAASAWFMPS